MDYNMRFRDIGGLGAAAAGFYPMFVGTPEADLVYDINHTLYTIEAPAEMDGMENENHETEVGIFEEINYGTNTNTAGRNRVFDNAFIDQNADRKFDILSDKLNKVLESGKYPEGTVEYEMLRYLDYGIRHIKERDFVFDPEKRIDTKKYYETCTCISKVANYGFIPMMTEEQISTLKPDNVTFFFMPSEEVKRMAYTKDELQESAEASNFSGVYKAGYRHIDAINEFTQTVGIEHPDTAEKQDILRQKLLGDVINLKNEMLKAVNVDITDPVVQRAFDGKEDQTYDGLTSSGRGYNGNIPQLTDYETYLKSALPPEGYADYHHTYSNVLALLDTAKTFGDKVLDGNKVADALSDCRDLLEALPAPGAGEDEIKKWKEDLRKACASADREIKSLNAAVESAKPPAGATDEEKNTWKKDLDDLKDKMGGKGSVFNTKAGLLISNADNLLNADTTMHDFFHNERMSFMEGLEEDRKNLHRTLKAFRDRGSKSFDPDTLQAIDKAISACDPEAHVSPQEAVKALRSLYETANPKAGLFADGNDKEKHTYASHYAPLVEMLENNIPYFEHKMSAAEKRGVMLDESILRQQRMENRKGQSNIAEALESFNTSRLIGKESTEHRLARESAERLIMKNAVLNSIDKNADPRKWEEQARKVMEEAQIASDLSREYLMAKNYSAGTIAGGKRLTGAADLYREAELIRLNMKKSLQLSERYNAMREDTLHIEPVNEDELHAARDKSMAVNATRKEISSFINDKNNTLDEKMDSVMGLFCASLLEEDAGKKKLYTDLLKDAVFPHAEGDKELNPDKMKEFFMNLGKYTLNSSLEYVKEADRNQLDDTLRVQTELASDLAEKIGEYLDDYRIRYHNSRLSENERAEKAITVDKIQEWYREGIEAAREGLSEGDRQLMDDGDRIINEAIAEQNLSENQLNDKYNTAKREFMEMMHQNTGLAYDQTLQEKEQEIAQKRSVEADNARKLKEADEAAKQQRIERRKAEADKHKKLSKDDVKNMLKGDAPKNRDRRNSVKEPAKRPALEKPEEKDAPQKAAPGKGGKA